jgi:pyruvate/2-oxoglutarate dehydrogenase complex dihydrolipoamide dehydrogenase (E3) component
MSGGGLGGDRVGEQVLESERIFIDTGARPSTPRVPGLDQAGCLTNESILQVPDLPEHSLAAPRDLAGVTHDD